MVYMVYNCVYYCDTLCLLLYVYIHCVYYCMCIYIVSIIVCCMCIYMLHTWVALRRMRIKDTYVVCIYVQKTVLEMGLMRETYLGSTAQNAYYWYAYYAYYGYDV
jgi:hypothetical protein